MDYIIFMLVAGYNYKTCAKMSDVMKNKMLIIAH